MSRHTRETSQWRDAGVVYVRFIFLFLHFWMPLFGPETTLPLRGQDILGSCAHSTQPGPRESRVYADSGHWPATKAGRAINKRGRGLPASLVAVYLDKSSLFGQEQRAPAGVSQNNSRGRGWDFLPMENLR